LLTCLLSVAAGTGGQHAAATGKGGQSDAACAARTQTDTGSSSSSNRRDSRDRRGQTDSKKTADTLWKRTTSQWDVIANFVYNATLNQCRLCVRSIRCVVSRL
jgi:hypothetical protein